MLSQVWRSNNGKEWTMVTDKPGWSGRKAHRVVVLNNMLWLMGGQEGDIYSPTPLNDVWYSSDGEKWTCATSAAPWSKRAYFAAAVFDNKIWVFGGESGQTNCNDVWYSSDGKNWTNATSAAAWSKRNSHEAFAFDNKLWVLGGADGSGSGYLSDVWYSPDGKTWTKAANGPWIGRRHFASAIFNNKAWISGGNNDIKFLTDVWYTELSSSIHNNVKPGSSAIPIVINTMHSSLSGGPVTIQYTINRTDVVKIGIYSCTGRLLLVLTDGVQRTGVHSIAWNGTDATGKTAGSGAYFVRFETENGNVTQTIIKSK